jgi:predicted amidophosphoribosyltransferase
MSVNLLEKDAYFWSLCRKIYKKAENGHVNKTDQKQKHERCLCMRCKEPVGTMTRLCSKCKEIIKKFGVRATQTPHKMARMDNLWEGLE